ncbi:PLP-dependent aminotransferase family protein [Sporosarcina sp. HYO08]|uniref:MocR-like transcriptional regulator GabR n=1 Tax=Sporosarcina sp. HYO08 TaxID=1759557 RepID=UPI000797D673|nr:PLP-dependent aminotransferase family protein [Sporosarcina sp. HYO08]KXH83787.1 GntR family transcriptional regulator [Sporosarcina sp. HYO08]
MLLKNAGKNGNHQYKYQQIYKGIKEQILEGDLQTNEKLPSKRKLASQLRVSVNSVTNAYEQLLAEGYIYSIERKGYYVEQITKFTDKDLTSRKLPDDLKEQTSDKEGWLSFSHMTSDISKFPFDTWIKSKQKAISNHKTELSEIANSQGPYLVRKTISRLIKLNRGVICEPEQIVIGSGTQLLIQQLMNTLQSTSDIDTVIAIENPGYSRFYNLLKKMNLDVKPIQLNKDGIDIKKVESSGAKFVIVTPSHQFPTGKIMPISRRIELLNWTSQSTNRYIIEDDYDSEFKYKTDNIPSLQSLDRSNRVIYTGTFSKTLLPSFRISYMVLPSDLLKVYKKQNADLIHSSNTLSLYTLHYFIEDGEYGKHLKKMNNHYEVKRKVLIEKLRNRFGTRIHIEDVPAGLHFFATFQTKKSYSEIEERAEMNKLEVYTLKRFLLTNERDNENEKSLVIGFASIEVEKMEEAVERLYQIISN